MVMKGPRLVFGLLLLAGSAGAQSRLAAPEEISLAPASFGTSAPGAAVMTVPALSRLSPSLASTLSAASVQPAPSVTAVAQAFALAPLQPVIPAASRPLAGEDSPISANALKPVSAPDAANARGMKRVRALLDAARNWLFKPVPEGDAIPRTFKLKDGDYYYHGTTLEDLIRVVESGGEMAPEVSQYSIRSADSIMYAAGRRAKLGRPDNPAVLLQFGYEQLRPLVSADAFKADVLAAATMSYFSLHSAYAAATKPVPLSMMTPQSKESLLSFLRTQETLHPDQPKWADLHVKFERVLDRR